MKKLKISPSLLLIIRKVLLYAVVAFIALYLFIQQDSLKNTTQQLRSDLESLQLQTNDEKGKFFELRKNFAGISGVEYGAEILFTLAGSNTIGDELAPALAAGYLQEMGALGQIRISRFKNDSNRILVKANIPGQDWPQGIDIRARGSESAFKYLSEDKSDIAMASRKITPSEVSLLQTKGFENMGSMNARRIVAMDGLALIVHPENPINSLSLDQITAAFTGKLRDWILIGGGNGKIKLYVRNDESGSRTFFEDHVLKNQSVHSSAMTFASNNELVKAVLQDKNALGVVSLAYINEAKSLAVLNEKGVPVHPFAASVINKDYYISRPLYLYAPTKTENFFAREFLAFSMSERGQDIVNKSGFVPSQEVRTITFGKVKGQSLPGEYLEIIEKSEQLSLTLRFKPNEVVLNAKAKSDLDRLKKFIDDNRASLKKIYFVGLSDNNGQAAENLNLSIQRAEVVRKDLLAKRISVDPSVVVATGFGDVKPIAPNTTEEGRSINRRVEVWVERK